MGYTQASLPAVRRRPAVAGPCQSTSSAKDCRNQHERLPVSMQMQTWSCQCPSTECCGMSAVVVRQPAATAASELALGEVQRPRQQLQPLRTMWLEPQWAGHNVYYVVQDIVVKLLCTPCPSPPCHWFQVLLTTHHAQLSAGRYANNLHLATPTPPSLNFYRLDALPDAQPTVSKHWSGQLRDVIISHLTWLVYL